MSSKRPRLFRDPVHDVIAFEDTPCDQLLLDLIDCKEVQRLRRIKQLGFTELVFPAANHSRFAHSLGVLHVARQFLDKLQHQAGSQLDEEKKTLILAAALLHDTGHGPFSHAFEKITEQRHEKRTLEIISDDSTQVHQALKRHNPDLPDQLTRFFTKDPEAKPASSLPPYLAHIIDSQFDADRSDYLLRDSHATGTNYGDYDLSWLIAQLHLQPDGSRYCLSQKALLAVEAYLFARYHMYRVVYFHKTTRAAEVMLRLLFTRYRALLAEVEGSKKAAVVPGGSPHILAAFSGAISLADYLELDDYTVLEFLKACARAPDALLVELSTGLLNRQLFKGIDVSELVQTEEVGKILAFDRAVQERLRQLGLVPEHVFSEDSASDTPYKAYDPDNKNPAMQIYVESREGKPQEISTLLDTVRPLRNKYSLLRYYFPSRLRGEIEAVANAKLTEKKS